MRIVGLAVLPVNKYAGVIVINLVELFFFVFDVVVVVIVMIVLVMNAHRFAESFYNGK